MVFGYDDKLVGRLVDRMAATDTGRIPIIRRSDNTVVGLVARHDLLRVRANVVREEREPEVLLHFRPRRVAVE